MDLPSTSLLEPPRFLLYCPSNVALSSQMVDLETDTSSGYLNTWQQCHTDTVAAVDINTDKQQVSLCVCNTLMLCP